MRHHDVVRGQVRHHPLHHLEQGIVVRNEDLDVIAKLRHFRGRTHKIRHRSWRPVPNENVIPAFAQIVHHPLADDAQTHHSNIFPCPTRHLQKLILGVHPKLIG